MNQECSTFVYMSTTITIRADESLRDALVRRAEAQGKNFSEFVREVLQAAVADSSVEARVGHLRGRLRLGRKSSDAWRKRLRERNWRP